MQAKLSTWFGWFVVLAICLAPAAIAAERPNLLLIIGDDVSYRDYGFMGATHVSTPNLDRLAREGMTYTRGYVPTSLCRASLMSIVTGLYPHQHGVVGNDPPKGTDRTKMLWAIRTHASLPKLLAPEGYYSFQTGKWWEGSPELGGFNAAMTHGDPAKGGRHGDEGLKIGRSTMAPIEEAIGEAQKQGKPFFIWYAPMLPHNPHDPPADLLEKYRPTTDSIHVARYWANVERFDRTIGEVREILARRGVEKETLILYLHDNGWIQSLDNPNVGPRSKRTPYEGGVRTPLIVHWPGKVAPGRDETTLVTSLDVVPTLLAAAGGKPSEGTPGLNLLSEDRSALQARDAVFGENYDHDVASLEEPAKGLQSRWCIVGTEKLIWDDRGGAAELYDLAKDPDEKENLAAAHGETVARLKKRLDAWWDGAKVAAPEKAGKSEAP